MQTDLLLAGVMLLSLIAPSVSVLIGRAGPHLLRWRRAPDNKGP